MRNQAAVRHTLRVVFVAALLASAIGCGAPETPPDHGRWGDATLIEDVRIGVYDEPSEYVFGRIGAIVPTADNSIYVYDQQLVSIRRYAPDGTYMRSIGAKGQGPGEFSRLIGMRVLPDQTLVVLDTPHRILLFGSDGTFIRDFRVESELYSSRGMLEIDVSGHLYVRAVDGEIKRGQVDWPFVLIKMNVHGEVLDRITLPRRRGTSPGIFSTATFHAWSPLGYIVVGRNDTYSISLGGGDADTLKIGRTIEPMPVGAEERREWQAYWDHREKRDREQGLTASQVTVPDMKPMFRDLRVAEDGRIWVQRHVQAEKQDVSSSTNRLGAPTISWWGPEAYDVFDPDGSFLGTVTLPADTRLHAARGTYVWCVARTDEGERVVRLRIEVWES